MQETKLFKIGDYVLANLEVTSSVNLNKNLRNRIGKIVSYGGINNYYRIEWEDLPDMHQGPWWDHELFSISSNRECIKLLKREG